MTKPEVIVVAQIIDSLNMGGAELMAVHIANAIAGTPGFKSMLIVTRNAGTLQQRVSGKVAVIYLHKTNRFDLGALSRLRQVIRRERIQILHAHGSSITMAAMLRMVMRFRLIWHDHYGKLLRADGKRNYPYALWSRWYNYVFCVSEELVQHNRRFLQCADDRIQYLPNFTVPQSPAASPDFLPATAGPIIIHLANLRPQKDHVNLFKAIAILVKSFPDLRLYCIGGGNSGPYFNELEAMVNRLGLTEHVLFTGPQANPYPYLHLSNLGVLSSQSEGMPLALLDYGLAKLPVVCTDVGKCREVVGQHGGLVVAAENATALAEAMRNIITDKRMAEEMAAHLNQRILQHYSQAAIMPQIVEVYDNYKQKSLTPA